MPQNAVQNNCTKADHIAHRSQLSRRQYLELQPGLRKLVRACSKQVFIAVKVMIYEQLMENRFVAGCASGRQLSAILSHPPYKRVTGSDPPAPAGKLTMHSYTRRLFWWPLPLVVLFWPVPGGFGIAQEPCNCIPRTYVGSWSGVAGTGESLPRTQTSTVGVVGDFSHSLDQERTA